MQPSSLNQTDTWLVAYLTNLETSKSMDLRMWWVNRSKRITTSLLCHTSVLIKPNPKPIALLLSMALLIWNASQLPSIFLLTERKLIFTSLILKQQPLSVEFLDQLVPIIPSQNKTVKLRKYTHQSLRTKSVKSQDSLVTISHWQFMLGLSAPQPFKRLHHRNPWYKTLPWIFNTNVISVLIKSQPHVTLPCTNLGLTLLLVQLSLWRIEMTSCHSLLLLNSWGIAILLVKLQTLHPGRAICLQLSVICKFHQA